MASTSRGFRRTFWKAESDLRLRPVPEQRLCLVYTPARPALHALNVTTWFVLTLCDGSAYADIARAFRRAAADTLGPGSSTEALRAALDQLLGLGLVRRVAAPVAHQENSPA